MLHLLGQFWEQGGRQRHHPIVSAFGTSNAQAASFKVEVFDVHIHGKTLTGAVGQRQSKAPGGK